MDGITYKSNTLQKMSVLDGSMQKKVYYFLKGEVLIVSSLFECNTRMLEKGFGHSKYSSCLILAMKKSTTSLHCKKLGSKSTVLILCVKQKSEVQLNLSSLSQIRFSKVTLMFSKFNVNHVHHHLSSVC